MSVSYCLSVQRKQKGRTLKVVALLAGLFGASTVFAETVIFSDTEFSESDWETLESPKCRSAVRRFSGRGSGASVARSAANLGRS